MKGLAEAIVLSIAGGALGCAARVRPRSTALHTLPPHVFPRLREIHVDGVVLAFALGLSVITGLAVGLLSAFACGERQRHESAAAIVLHASAALAGIRLRPSSLLVIVEIAAAVVLLTAGGLLVNSFVRLVRVDLGYDPRRRRCRAGVTAEEPLRHARGARALLSRHCRAAERSAGHRGRGGHQLSLPFSADRVRSAVDRRTGAPTNEAEIRYPARVPGLLPDAAHSARRRP